MNTKKDEKKKPRFVWVKDREGNEYVCPIHALKNPNELTEEEKAKCVDAKSPRGLVTPL